jgi:hypothetical protein
LNQVVTIAPTQKPASLFLQRGRALLSQGRTEEVCRWIEDFLQNQLLSATAWHDAGELFWAMNRQDEALRHFQRAVQLSDCPKEARLSLARTYTAVGQPASAIRLMGALAADGILQEALVEQIAGRFIQQQDLAGAAETMRRAARTFPDSQTLHALRERIRSCRAKIAFFCGADGATFLKPVIENLSLSYPVRIFEGTTPQQMMELMRWSDISWFEWCTNLAQLGSAMPKVCRTIVRLHRYEAYSDFMRQIRWENIDLLLTVGNSFVIDALRRWVPEIRSRVRIASVPNGVDLERIKFIPRRPGKKLAFVASLRWVKNLSLLLQCMAQLYRQDPTYKLHIAGHKTELLAEQYMDHQIRQLGLTEAVVFDGWQEDVQSWLADKNYLVVTSFIESQGMGCVEAMAAGVRPVIHHFPGAAEIYDSEYLFNTPTEFCEHILSGQYDSAQYREFVERRYASTVQLLKINEVVASLEARPVSALEQQARPA